jgi:hypothetical protein
MNKQGQDYRASFAPSEAQAPLPGQPSPNHSLQIWIQMKRANSSHNLKGGMDMGWRGRMIFLKF